MDMLISGDHNRNGWRERNCDRHFQKILVFISSRHVQLTGAAIGHGQFYLQLTDLRNL